MKLIKNNLCQSIWYVKNTREHKKTRCIFKFNTMIIAKWILFVFIVYYRKGFQLNGWPQNALKQRSTLQKRVMFGLMELSYGKYFPWVNKDCTFHPSIKNYIINTLHKLIFLCLKMYLTSKRQIIVFVEIEIGLFSHDICFFHTYYLNYILR